MKLLASALTLSTALVFSSLTPAEAALVQGDLRPQRLGAAQNPFLLANRITANSSAAASAERAIADVATAFVFGAVVKTGAGTLRLTGSSTFTGGTLVFNPGTITSGVVRLEPSGPLYLIGDGLTSSNTLTGVNQSGSFLPTLDFSGAGTLVINNGSLLQVNGTFPRHVIIDSAGNVVSATTTSPGSAPVPEPTAGLLAVLGACAAVARRKRLR